MEYGADVFILIVSLILYVLNQLIFKNIGVLFFNNYFNDLLAIPFYFAFINVVSISLRHKEINSFKILLFMTIFLSFLAEYVAIFFRKGSVMDYLDIICYFIGFIIYFLLKNWEKIDINKMWRF